MKNFEDRRKLEAVEQQKFIDQCKDEFVETSLAATNQKKVKQLTTTSFLPNIFSSITAGFFVWYLLSGYNKTVALILGFLLLLVIVSLEVGKRGLISTLAKEYFVSSNTPALAVIGLIACFALSMTASYLGGQQLVVETAPPPTKVINPQIDSLNNVLAAQQATIGRLQKTTWKGKVTRDATKGINQAKQLQNQIYARISTLEAQDDQLYTDTLTKHNSKHLNFGIVLGVLAALADFFLLGLLWTALKLKYQVAATNYSPTNTSTQSQNNYQIPSISNTNPSLNQEKRGIGFRMPKATTENRKTENRKELEKATETDEEGPPGKPTTENRNNGKSLTVPQPEVIVEKEVEVIELTDRVKECLHCNQKFVYYNSRAKYCSDACRVAAWEKRTGKTFNKRKKG